MTRYARGMNNASKWHPTSHLVKFNEACRGPGVIAVGRSRSVSLQQIILRGRAVPGSGVLTARGRGEVFAAVVVQYFPRRVVGKGTRENGNK